jgi:A/G-specific adenine glycosylase
VSSGVQKTVSVSFVAAVIVAEDLVYVQQRLPGRRWASLWEFPGGHLNVGETPAEAVLREVQEETEFSIDIQTPLPVVSHTYTKYRATLYPFLCRLVYPAIPATPVLHAAQDYRWLPLQALDALAFSAGHRKVITQLPNVFSLLPRG